MGRYILKPSKTHPHQEVSTDEDVLPVTEEHSLDVLEDEDIQFDADLLESEQLLSDRDDLSLDVKHLDFESDKYFEGCERAYITIGMLEEAERTGEYKQLIAGMESYYKLNLYCNEYLGMNIKGPGLESIINTPLSSLDAGLESIRGIIDNLVKAIGAIIKWVVDTANKMIKKITRILSGFGRKAKKTLSNLKNFIKTHPNCKELSERNSAAFVEWLTKKYKGINRLTSPHVSKTAGITGLGSTMVNLLEKEVNLVYPSIDTMPLGKDTEFFRGLTGFYRGKDILNCKKAIKDSPEFAKLVGATEKQVVDNDQVVCKIFSVDYEYAYFILLGGSTVSNFKPIIDKVKLEKVEMVVPDIKPDDGNKIFNGKPVEWLVHALEYIIKNQSKIMKKPEAMIKELSRVRADLNKAHAKYKTSKQNKDVASCIEMYMKFTKKVVTKYQEQTVKGCIASLKQLFEVTNRLYSDIIGSASIAEADRWDNAGQTTAKKVKEADLHGKSFNDHTLMNKVESSLPVRIATLGSARSKKQIDHDYRYGNGDDNDRGVKKAHGKGLFGRMFGNTGDIS